MKSYLIFLTSIRSLLANKLRTLLTLLGIIIGVATVLMMISVGTSASSAVTSSIKGLGSNLIFIYNLPNSPENKQINESDLSAIGRIPHVKKVLPQVSFSATIQYGSSTMDIQVNGTEPDFEEMRNAHPVLGRFITSVDIASSAKVAVIGYGVYEELFKDGSFFGKVVRINGMPFTVVGVLEKKGSQSLGYNPDDMVIVPITTAQQRILGSNRIDLISVEIDSESLVPIISNEIESLLKRRHMIESQEDESFRILTQEEIISTASQITGILTVLLAGIASISLLVGGIGIMNILLVTVTERTKEIGLRKAIGAKKSDIMLQFLIESITLCSIGGLLGILLGYLGSILIARFGGWIPVVSPSTIALSFSFAVLVGLFFGIYPAYKAASLNPIDALRYE
ncbi:MAG: ABC transporter permease [Actinobacteria bacterium]|nr:ABC transporter permease [Actinomycetota bacterium]